MYRSGEWAHHLQVAQDETLNCTSPLLFTLAVDMQWLGAIVGVWICGAYCQIASFERNEFNYSSKLPIDPLKIVPFVQFPLVFVHHY
jgi:hypothetical protein